MHTKNDLWAGSSWCKRDERDPVKKWELLILSTALYRQSSQ